MRGWERSNCLPTSKLSGPLLFRPFRPFRPGELAHRLSSDQRSPPIRDYQGHQAWGNSRYFATPPIVSPRGSRWLCRWNVGCFLTDSLLCPWGKKTLTFSLNSTRLIRTPHYYGQFAVSLGKGSPYIFSKFNPLNTDNPLIRALSMTPSVSVLTEFDCIYKTEKLKDKQKKKRGKPLMVMHFLIICSAVTSILESGWTIPTNT